MYWYAEILNLTILYVSNYVTYVSAFSDNDNAQQSRFYNDFR